MPKFSPETTIFFASTGVDDNNKTVHDTTSAFVEWARTFILRSEMSNCSFQRIDQGWEIRVDLELIDYDMLLLADTVCLTNGTGFGGYHYVGIIDRVEWKNPNCAFVYFHIDWYTSMLGNVDYEETYAYIEREHIVKDWNGNSPEFSNMGPEEDFAVNPDTPINTEKIEFHFDEEWVLVYTPYNDSGKPNFTGSMVDGLYSSMYTFKAHPDQVNEYLQTIAEAETADLGQIVAIHSIPDEFMSRRGNKQETFQMPWIKKVPSCPDYRNAKCWSGQFCQIKLMSGTGQSVNINPQWFGSGQSEFSVDINWFFNNGDGGCTMTAINKNTSYDKVTYNDFQVSLTGLPTAPWVGNYYAQWASANMRNLIMQGALSSIGTAVQGANQVIQKAAIGDKTGAQVTAVTSLLSNTAIAEAVAATIKNQKTSGTVVTGSPGSDVNTALALDKYGFQIVMYMTQQYLMYAVDDYFDRFGYRVNRLKKINRKARPKWTYVKCHEVHVMGNHIPMNARAYIQSILVNGVTFWRDGVTIGDYSNPEGNKA